MGKLLQGGREADGLLISMKTGKRKDGKTNVFSRTARRGDIKRD